MKKLLIAAAFVIAGSVALADTTSVLLDPARAKSMTEAEYLAAVRDAKNGNARAEDGRTPLHVAAKLGTRQVVSALLEGGASGSVKNSEGKTPFDRHCPDDLQV